MASSVTLKNRESKSNKKEESRIANLWLLYLRSERKGGVPWVSCVTEIIVAERKKTCKQKRTRLCRDVVALLLKIEKVDVRDGNTVAEKKRGGKTRYPSMP